MIRIENIIDDLNKEVYDFYFDERDFTLYLNSYNYYQRQTKRHKFKPIKSFDRLQVGSAWYMGITENEVPLTEDIKKQAIEYVSSRLVVKLWSERNR